MTRTCPTCGSPVAAGERFCGECGTDMSAVQQQPNNAGRVQPVNTGPQVPVNYPVQQPNPNSFPGQPTYVAPMPPMQQQNSGAGTQRILGIILLVVAVLAFIGMLALGYATAGTQPTLAEENNTRLGSWICAFGLLIILGIPGLVLTLIGRKR